MPYSIGSAPSARVQPARRPMSLLAWTVEQSCRVCHANKSSSGPGEPQSTAGLLLGSTQASSSASSMSQGSPPVVPVLGQSHSHIHTLARHVAMLGQSRPQIPGHGSGPQPGPKVLSSGSTVVTGVVVMLEVAPGSGPLLVPPVLL